ncbi:peptide/nickel transport system ATP-binding protein [Frigoribacterium sp. PhB160]|uniref:dipeptide ABC transporter ATP-binding protein n=1 Tax=Frigoribacterium sp. PhB160 TaxID=2485192 RepID=UPI000F4AC323|nr:ABC transporter ATP-binding protein [Frigoribacterium sp. PhB160]ROS61480.1 peptide/nickel transport system ATP-binding protein [Frigoribacterium sp. PhB160]
MTRHDTVASTPPGPGAADAPAPRDAPAAREAPAATAADAPAAPAPTPRLSVRDLNVSFRHGAERRHVVHDVSFDLHAGECVAIVGESGSGKSVTARTLVGLTGGASEVEATRLRFDGRDVADLTAREWRRIRGARIGFVLQDALVSLDPLRPVGHEIEEALRLHGVRGRRARRARAVELLASVGVPEPELRAGQRPDQLSGGLRQRALIASAVALDPEVVIADEPTTALDVTVQAQVLDLLEQQKSRGVSVLLISHDLSVVARLADRVLVMRGGHVVEEGRTADVLRDPQHDYTKSLLAAVPGEHTRGTRLTLRSAASPTGGGRPEARVGSATPVASPSGAAPTAGPDGRDPLDVPVPRVAGPGWLRDAAVAAADTAPPVLEASGLVKRFRTGRGSSRTAVDGVSFTLGRGRTLGIVGESGSGKSTTARIALALETADEGEVRLLGEAWSGLPETQRRARRHLVTVVQQDPLSSFDPRWNVERILLDALPAGVGAGAGAGAGAGGASGAAGASRAEARRARVRELVDQVGLPREALTRFPLQLSGGQRQRVSIARALAPDPVLVVLDEAVSALDVSVQAQVLDLLADLQRDLGLSYLFISHDLGVIYHVSDDVLVMKDGVVVERGSAADVFERPRHPYTQELVAALPRLSEPGTGGVAVPTAP